MKKQTYWFGDLRGEAYYKQCGEGWEVGFFFGKDRVFVGNFIHQTEAKKWWAMMTKEVYGFGRKYSVTEEVSFAWYKKFFSHHLYRCYYAWLDKEFAGYQVKFNKAFAKDQKKYKAISKKFDGDLLYFKRAM
ncbi:MAG: hypothetical protein AAB250_16845 [Bdellovibrionota bacterium]